MAITVIISLLISIMVSTISLAEVVECRLARGKSAHKVLTFNSLWRLPLGKNPRKIRLKDEKKTGDSHENPHPDDANTFVRAASGVSFQGGKGSDPVSLLLAQDSRRFLGVSDFTVSYSKVASNLRTKSWGAPTVSMIPLATDADIKSLENDGRDYTSFRKRYKEDYEAMTTLPSGEILIVSSGSDSRKFPKKKSYRSVMIIFEPGSKKVTRFEVPEFYSRLNRDTRIVGNGRGAGINIEGVAIKPGPMQDHKISFFHRGNYGESGEDAVVEFSLKEWLLALKSGIHEKLAAVPIIRVVKFKMPQIKVEEANGKMRIFRANLGDALFGYLKGRSTFLMPVGVEADYIDKNRIHHDGDVVFVGLAVWQVATTGKPASCKVFQAPGDPLPGQLSRFGKLEGLAAYSLTGKNAFEKSWYSDTALLVGVTDVDSEIQPSMLTALSF